jgi:hypothetical protein
MNKPFSLVRASTLFFCAAAILSLYSTADAQSPNPLYQHLPPTANHVYSIRLGQIIAKGELVDILNSMPPSKDPNSAMAFKMIKDPASVGVDLNHEILIAQTTASGAGADTVSYSQVFIPLTDSAKFRKAFSEALKDQRLHRVPGKGVTVSKGLDGMAWNDRLFVITSASGETPVSDARPAHKAAPTVHRSLAELAVEKSLAALTGYSGTLWLTDQRFITGFATEEDFHAWSTKMDFTSMFSKLGKKMAAKMLAKHGQSFPDSAKATPFADKSSTDQFPHPPVLSTFSFENGRIIFRMNILYNPEDAQLFHRLYDRPIDKDLLARVPPGLLLGFAALHFNPSAVPDVLDRFHARHMVDSMLGKKGLSLTDISGVFGGDFMIAALGDTTATTDTSKKKINVYFVASLGNPAALMNIAGRVAANPDMATDSSMVKMKKLAEKIAVQDNLLVVSGSKEMAQKYFAPHDRRSTDLLGDNTAMQTAVVDLKAVSTFISATMSGNPKVMVFARILERLDKAELKSGFSEGNNGVLTFQILTGDPSTNSLKTIVSLLH